MYLPRKWPVGISLLIDESFASWFARIAWAHGATPSELYRIALPGARIGGVDLDRHACDDLIFNLSRNAGVPAAELEARTIRHWRGLVYDTDDGKTPIVWLPPAGRAYAKSSFGQQVCPSCLAEDPEPYYRTNWRLSFYSVCTRHRQIMVDRCPSCTHPLHPSSTVAGATLALCGVCGFDLRAIAAAKVPERDLAAQIRLLKVASGDWQPMGNYGTVHPVLFFRLFALLYRLVSSGRHALPLRQLLMPAKSSVRAEAIPRIQEIDRHPARVRHLLVSLAWELAQNWPHRYVEACDAVGLHRWLLVKEPKDVPFVYADAVSRYLVRQMHHVGAQEVDAVSRHLSAAGRVPTYEALQSVLGVKFHAARKLAAPVKAHKPYGTHRYWKLDGVSPATRAAVKRAAHKAGENVGAWVDLALQSALKAQVKR
jgi:hypothetical protein